MEKKSFLYSNILLVIVWGVRKRRCWKKYNAVVEKVGEVRLTNDINLQGKRDYGEDH